MTTWPPSTHQDVQDVVGLLMDSGRLATGQSAYYFTISPHANSANSFPNGTMRVYPWVLTNTVTISTVGVETTIVGNAGAVVRLGLYTHSETTGLPTSLLYDFGTVAADAVAAPELTVTQSLNPGVYWWASVVQNAASTAPTLRSASVYPPVIPLPHSANTAGTTRTGYAHSGTVSGALPGSFVFSGGTATLPRIYIKVA